MPGIVNLLNDDSILAFVVPVLFNTCVDYGKNCSEQILSEVN